MYKAKTKWSQDSYRAAMHFAAIAHGEQKVPGKPYSYIVHISNVCMEVIATVRKMKGLDENLAIICAILHDVIEDTTVSNTKLKTQFGTKIYKGVMALTKRKDIAKDRQMKDSLKRIKKEPVEIGIVKMADRIVNLETPPQNWTNEKIKEYYEEAKIILKELKQCSPFLAKRLDKKIKDYRKFIIKNRKIEERDITSR
jgi:(p)ppGpp synthase/HD superfamily hydrolase